MACWLRKGCVSAGGGAMCALRDPHWAGPPAVEIVGLGSGLDWDKWGFRKWARGSNPEPNSCDESREGAGTGRDGGGENRGLDWTTWGWGWWGGTGPPPLLKEEWCGLLVSLVNTAFFCFCCCCCCCLGTSPSKGERSKKEVRGDPGKNVGWGWVRVLSPFSESSLSSEESLLPDEEEPVFIFETSKAFSAVCVEGGDGDDDDDVSDNRLSHEICNLSRHVSNKDVKQDVKYTGPNRS